MFLSDSAGSITLHWKAILKRIYVSECTGMSMSAPCAVWRQEKHGEKGIISGNRRSFAHFKKKQQYRYWAIAFAFVICMAMYLSYNQLMRESKRNQKKVKVCGKKQLIMS